MYIGITYKMIYIIICIIIICMYLCSYLAHIAAFASASTLGHFRLLLSLYVLTFFKCGRTNLRIKYTAVMVTLDRRADARERRPRASMNFVLIRADTGRI